MKDKLVARIRPFVDAKNPGDANDTETKAFEARIRVEAEDLKLESFGVEVSLRVFSIVLIRPATDDSFCIPFLAYTLRKRATLSSRRSSSAVASLVD